MGQAFLLNGGINNMSTNSNDIDFAVGKIIILNDIPTNSTSITLCNDQCIDFSGCKFTMTACPESITTDLDYLGQDDYYTVGGHFNANWGTNDDGSWDGYNKVAHLMSFTYDGYGSCRYTFLIDGILTTLDNTYTTGKDELGVIPVGTMGDGVVTVDGRNVKTTVSYVSPWSTTGKLSNMTYSGFSIAFAPKYFCVAWGVEK